MCNTKITQINPRPLTWDWNEDLEPPSLPPLFIKFNTMPMFIFVRARFHYESFNASPKSKVKPPPSPQFTQCCSRQHFLPAEENETSARASRPVEASALEARGRGRSHAHGVPLTQSLDHVLGQEHPKLGEKKHNNNSSSGSKARRTHI